MNNAVDWGMVGALVLVGLLVVFAVLVILIFLVFAFGQTLSAAENISARIKEKKKKKTQQAAEVPASTQTEARPAPAKVEQGIPSEVVAAISAAVTVMMGGKAHKIRSVKRVKETRSAWSMAGIADNTRSF